MLSDGIYLNLPMELYRADPALGGSDLKDILFNPVQWHANARNRAWRELNPQEETPATRFGTALHTMVLEPDTWEARCYVEPVTPELPATKEDINHAILKLGHIPLKSSQKLGEYEDIARGYGIPLLKDWKAAQAREAAGRERITQEWHRALVMLRAVLLKHSRAMKYLTNGRAEVSVFFTDPVTNVRLKCRFDYLRVRPCADVKSHAYRDGKEVVQGFVDAIETYGYDFSAAHYMDLRTRALPALVDGGLMFDAADALDEENPEIRPACADDVAFLQRVAGETKPTWVWIACLTMGFPEVDAIELPGDLLHYSTAAYQVEQARETYREYRERFGDEPDVPWVADRGLVRLTDFNFMSPRAKGRGEVKWEPGG